MSKQVDERVVSMQFDNRHFEKNVQNTMNTLDKLKQSLDLKGASKGLENVDAAAKKVDMSKLSESVETVGLKFNALYSIADQSLRNITNSAMNAGKKIVSALAIDPIKTGFQEYETQINSVQTILANTESKGSTLQDVNNALAELNTYADKTIYNFTEMTRNIGTFTAAGVDLKTSVSAIKGIANLAAVSGSNSQQASTAMYQLSQALASGTVKLMDWNSVVNAGMGGQVFQDSLKETARVHGINIDAMIAKEGSFRETLKNEWLTADILTETLAKFTGDLSESQLKALGYTEDQIKSIVKMGNTANDAATKVKTFTQLFDTLKEAAQSGWTKSWEILIGDFGEAKELLTDISDLVGGVIGGSADKRNEVLMSGLSTGWKQLLNEGINDAAGFEEMVSNVAKEHGVDIASMINDETSFQDALKKSLQEGTLTSDVLTESIAKFSDKVSKMSAEELEAAGYTKDHVEQLKKLDESVKNGTISMDEFSKLIVRPSGRELLIESLWNSIKAIQSVITPIKQAFEEVFEPLTGDKLYSIIEGIRDFTANLTLSGEQSESLKNTFKGLFSVIEFGIDIVKSVVSGCVKLLGAILPVGDGLLSVTGSLGEFLSGITEAVDVTGIIDGLFQGTADILGTVASGIGAVLSALAGGISKCGGAIGIIQKIIDVIGQLFDKIHVANPGDTIFDTMFNIINGGMMTAIGAFILKTIKAISNFSDNAGGFLESITDILGGVGDALNAFTGSIKANTLKTIAISIGILSASLLVLSMIDSNKLTVALTAMATLFGELMMSFSLFNKIVNGKSFSGIAKASIALTSLSASILILSVALKIMSTMSWSEMSVGLVSLTVGLGALVGAVSLLPDKKVNNAAKAIKKLATAVLIYAAAMKIMGSMSWQELAVGLTAMVVGLGALVGALHLLPKDMTAKVSSMMILASSMVILGAAMKIMGSMSWQELAVGLTAMVVGLGALVGALHLLPKDTAGKAASVLVLSAAMMVLGAALKIMSSIPWQMMIVGVLGMAASLAVLVGALWLLPADVAGKAASILVLSAAMVVLGAALKIIGSLSVDQLVKGIGAIAATLIVLGIAAYALAPVSVVLLAIGGAVALLGIGCLAAGAGLVLLATGLTALAAAIVGSVGIILAGANELVGVFTTIILSIVTALVTCIPAITNGLLQLLVSVLTGLVQHTPTLVNLLFDFVIGLINALAARLPDLIQAGVNLLMAFFSGVVDALKSVDPSVLINGLMAVGVLSAIVAAMAAIALLTPAAMLGVLGMGAVVTELAIVIAALGALAQIPGLEWLIGEGGDLLQKIGTAIGQFVGGIVGGIAQGITSSLPQIGADLSAFMVSITPFIAGAQTISSSSMDGIKALVDAILLLTAANLVESLTSWLTGGSNFVEFGKQIAEFGPYIKKYADSVNGIDGKSIKASAEAAKSLVEVAKAIPNEGGWLAAIVGDNSLSSFAEALIPFGKNMKTYADSIKGINAGSISKINPDIKSMISISSSIENLNAKNFESNAKSFVNGLNRIKDFITGVAGIDASGIASFTQSMTLLANSGISALTEAFNNGGSAISTSISGMLKSAIKPDMASGFTKIGEDIVKNINKGIKSQNESMKKASKALITTSEKAIKTKTTYNAFSNVGKYVVEGFANGITKNTYIAEAKAKAMAKAAEEAAKKELDVNSPSKKFMTIGSSVVEGFSQGITDNFSCLDKSAKLMSKSILSATQKELKINSPSLVFDKEVGRYIVQGVAEGITKDMSAEEAAEKKAQNIVSAFKKAIDRENLYADITRNELTIWENGVGKNASEDEKSKKRIEYANKELVYKQRAQSLAYNEWQESAKTLGETSDATKEAWKKYLSAQVEVLAVQNTISDENKAISERAVEAVEDDINRYERSIETRDKLREEWLRTDGKKASEADIDARFVADFKKDISDYKDMAEASRRKEDMLKANNADEEEIHAQWLKTKEYEQKISDIQASIIGMEDDQLERDIAEYSKAVDINNKLHENWLKTRGKNASDTEKDAHAIETIDQEIAYYKIMLDKNNDRHEMLVKNNATDEEIYKAWQDSVDYENKIADLQAEKLAIKDNALQRAMDGYDYNVSSRDRYRELWDETDGKDASDAEKDTRAIEDLNADIADKSNKLLVASEAYTKAVEDHGMQSEEARKAWDNIVDIQLDIAKDKNEIAQIQEDALTRERELLEEQHDLASDNADLEYQIWEKTLGRKATSAEKDVARLASLSNQLLSQSAIVQMAREDWEKACNEYGKSSNEAQKAYGEYLQKQLSLANIQNEITDINESAAERQKLAKSEYRDYVEKYKEFYRKNGMSMRELEKDAQLVSGYDPNSTVNTIVDKTNTALKNVQESEGYNELLSNFNSMGVSYVDAVNNGVVTETASIVNCIIGMIDKCTATIKTKQEEWIAAGKYLVDGFALGITNNIQTVVNKVVDLSAAVTTAMQKELGINSPSRAFAIIGMYAVQGLAKGLYENSDLSDIAATDIGKSAIANLQNSIKRISEVVESDIDTQPTIRPVLDLSNVESGANRLNAIFSRSQAMSISNSMSKKYDDKEIQNGTNNTPVGNNYSFVQNNYSPKALSRSEIYRQTKNQFAAMKGAMT